MLKLIKLEIKKFGLKGFIRGAIIADLVILALMLLMVMEPSETGETFPDYASLFSAIGIFTKATFTIFAAAHIARLIIGEFNHKTITVLFMYPISRKKLMAAKLAIIAAFTFTAILTANLVLGAFFCIFNTLHPFIADSLSNAKVMGFLTSSLLDAIAFTGVSFIPMYFGMRKKSVVTTIVTSILVTVLLSSNNNGFTLSSIIIIPFLFAAIGVIIAYLSIRNIEHKDVEN